MRGKEGEMSVEGNENALKYKTPEDALPVYERYCDHLAAGYSKEAFPDCDYRTIESCAAKWPSVLQPEKMIDALREGRLMWENMGLLGANGTLRFFNPTAWIFNMKNRYAWADKQEIDHTTKGERIGAIEVVIRSGADIVTREEDIEEP